MSKGDRRRSARDKLAEQRARDVQREKRRNMTLITGGAVVGLALVVGIGVWAVNSGEDKTAKATAYTGPLAPVTRESTGAITMAKPGVTTPLLEIFEDFQCPICKTFESTSGATIKKLAAQGEAKVVYWPFQLFQQQPLSGNSRRAANAALCTPTAQWVSYHDTLYKNQPAEGTTGFSNSSLVGWGKDLGVTGSAFAACVDKQQKATQLDQMTKTATGTRGVQGTPTVYLNGKTLDLTKQLLQPTVLQQSIEAAK
jgi:protein-disulfide isomerase